MRTDPERTCRLKASYSLMVQPETQRIADLKGKTLGASALRTGEVVFMKALLRKYGLTENDYSLVVAGASGLRRSCRSSGRPPDTHPCLRPQRHWVDRHGC